MKHGNTIKNTVSRHGVGLVEILVGIVIMGVLLAVAVPSLTSFMERRRVMAVTDELNSIIAYAKSETNAIGDSVTIHLEDDPSNLVSCAAVVTQTLVDVCRCYYAPSQICPVGGGSKMLRLFQLPRSDGVSFQATALSWGASNQTLTFSRNTHFRFEQGVSLTVTGQRTGVQLKIDINEAGRASTCSPGGGIAAFPAC